MNFRWVMGITLWTFLSGPIFSGPRLVPPAPNRSAAGAAHRAASAAAKSVPAAPRRADEKN